MGPRSWSPLAAQLMQPRARPAASCRAVSKAAISASHRTCRAQDGVSGCNSSCDGSCAVPSSRVGSSDGERERSFLEAVRKSMRAIRDALGAATIDPALLTAAERLQHEGFLRRERTARHVGGDPAPAGGADAGARDAEVAISPHLGEADGLGARSPHQDRHPLRRASMAGAGRPRPA